MSYFHRMGCSRMISFRWSTQEHDSFRAQNAIGVVVRTSCRNDLNEGECVSRGRGAESRWVIIMRQ